MALIEASRAADKGADSSYLDLALAKTDVCSLSLHCFVPHLVFPELPRPAKGFLAHWTAVQTVAGVNPLVAPQDAQLAEPLLVSPLMGNQGSFGPESLRADIADEGPLAAVNAEM